MAYDALSESVADLSSGLPQCTSLSPILFVIYAGALTERHKTGKAQVSKVYVNNEIMVHRSKTQLGVAYILPARLKKMIEWPGFRNI